MSDQAICVVVIGRNEGERLIRCLQSVVAPGRPVIYVDSGSTDGSVEKAKAMGAEVVPLDLSIPFTAARGRNAGWRYALERYPETAFVQFVDGDCEVVPGWIEAATGFLEANPKAAAACGRRRERFPEASVYNRMCDEEWNTPVGIAKACGGDVMMRAEALVQSGGYRDSLIAGEEPELCVRLRARGREIWRLDQEMTLHDAAMTRFGQWWKRTMRGGFAFAEGAQLHGAPPERHWVAEARRAMAWGMGVPLIALVLAVPAGPIGFCLLLVYPLQFLRLALRLPGKHRTARAFFLVLGKVPEAFGVLKFHRQRMSGRTGRLIEYKT